MVSALEHVLRHKIDLELGRQANGTPPPLRVRDYSNLVRQVKDLGGEECLKTLGLPGSARNLRVTAPSQVKVNQSFTVQISVEKADGGSLASEDIYVRVSRDAVGADYQQVVRTNSSGQARFEVTAGSSPGDIFLRVQVLGESQSATVDVVAQQVSYRTHIQPLFTRRCTSCHDPTTFHAGGLDLRSYAGLMSGGQSGPAVIAQAPGDSLLVARVEATQSAMPPSGDPLTPSEKQLIRDWIDQGALDN